jgi:transcriptional regulator with XRE-family HTH domain
LHVVADYAIKSAVVRELRNRKLMTQKRLSEVAGVSKQTITRMETGSNVAQFDTIVKVAGALGVDPGVLIEYRADSRMSEENQIKVEDKLTEFDERRDRKREGLGDAPDTRDRAL